MLNPLLPWLEWPYSLTDKLISLAEEIRLELLFQDWVPPNWWDKYVLKLQEKAVIHREIVMWADHKPCWYARTIIPQSTFQKYVVFFNRLENESLGQLVFDNQNIRRLSLSHYPLTTRFIEYHWLNPALHNNEDTLWARQSVFSTLDNLQFFLIEILLPPLLRYEI